jgi:gliding motility-associated-like protein
MRKCLLLVALLIGAQGTDLSAQGLFSLPSDTVCIRQPIKLQNNVPNSISYYWGFCSGYLQNAPVVINQGSGFNLDAPNSIEVANDGGNYYAFVINRGAGGGAGELLRLSYGNSQNNAPVITSLGTLENNIPPQSNNLFLVKTRGEWFMFITSGSGTSSTLTRVDFRNSLANTPNSVNFGNIDNLLDNPTGIFVAEDAGNYYGFITNSGNDNLIRLDFGPNISLTPDATNLGTLGAAFSGPSDITGVLDNGFWYLFVTNEGSNTLTRVELGNTLANGPTIVPVPEVNGNLFQPSGISIVRDCDMTYAFVSNRLSGSVTKVEIPSFTGTYTATNVNAPTGSFAGPADISRVMRENDNLYAYVINRNDNTLTQVGFTQCSNASVQSSVTPNPPVYSYNLPGIYNIYLAVNEGQPDAQVQCLQINVLPLPPVSITNDTTICQGDTARIFIQSPDALAYTWRPNYNITDTSGFDLRAYPEYTTRYFVNIPYPNGCIMDTSMLITVNKNNADAGPDRVLADGGSTLIGGPLTTQGPQYTYTWYPNQYLESPYTPVTKANPATDLTYYLEVRDNNGCVSVDTVTILVNCNDLNLPNAFAPASGNRATNTFGIMNRQIVQLNYFRIFDRWGQEVFSTTDPTKRWDGNVNGEPAALGVYVWEADGFCTNQKRFTKAGNVTLIR